MAKTVKTADLGGCLAARLFEALNPDVEYLEFDPIDLSNYAGVIVTDEDPESLIYPEGWYFSKGYFRNKHNSSTGLYEEIPMARRDGTYWL